MLTKEQKKIWLDWADTLEFGNLKQTRGHLCAASINGDKVNASYCCLGVLCAMHNAATAPKENNWQWRSPVIVRHGIRSPKEEAGYAVAYLGSESMPPTSVQIWAGLDPSIAGTFATLNDGCYLSFKRIAHRIREYVRSGSTRDLYSWRDLYSC